MYKYQISRVLEVFDGSSFEAVIDLGMGVYLKKVIYLSGIDSPDPKSTDRETKFYAYNATNKLRHYIKDDLVGTLYVEVIDYHDDYLWGDIYTEQFDHSINKQMYLMGYVWDNGIDLTKEELPKVRELYVLSTPPEKYMGLL